MPFCLLAFVIGAVCATTAPVMQFAVGLIVVTLAGGVAALLTGAAWSAAALSCAVLFACAQVGYGLGVGLMAWMGARRSTRNKRDDAVGSLTPLHRP